MLRLLLFLRISLQFCGGTYTDDENEGKFHLDQFCSSEQVTISNVCLFKDLPSFNPSPGHMHVKEIVSCISRHVSIFGLRERFRVRLAVKQEKMSLPVFSTDSYGELKMAGNCAHCL